MKPLSESAHNSKAVNEGATYWVCSPCDKKLRARGEQDSTEVWKCPPKCPTAAKGERGCNCCCEPKRAAPSGKKRKIFSSSKKQKSKDR
jgi:hypothetical protein